MEKLLTWQLLSFLIWTEAGRDLAKAKIMTTLESKKDDTYGEGKTKTKILKPMEREPKHEVDDSSIWAHLSVRPLTNRFECAALRDGILYVDYLKWQKDLK